MLHADTCTQTSTLSCLQSELTLTSGANSAAEEQTPTATEDITKCPPHWSVIHRAGPKGGLWLSGTTAGY